mgnify:FL=1
MANYFNVKLKPDLVDGDISKLIANDKTDTPFTADDILFDWQAIDVPSGTVRLESVTAYMIGEDGGAQPDKDFSLVFAKSVDGTAPTTLGEENAAQTACFELPLHFVGAIKIEATSASIPGLAFGTAFSWGAQGANGIDRSVIMSPEPISGTNVGYDKLYVAGFAGGAFDFSTGVLSTGAISADDNTTVEVDTVDARKAFQKDDICYVHDVDTALGTVSSVTSGVITLTTNNVVAVANNDEIINATPITIQLGFSQ